MHNKKQIAGLTDVPGLPWGPVGPCRKETIVTCFDSNPLTEWLTSIPIKTKYGCPILLANRGYFGQPCTLLYFLLLYCKSN